MELLKISGGVCAAQGFVAAGVHCGIRKSQAKKDLAMIVSNAPCSAAACYTKNKVYGAPITVTRAHIADGTAQAVIVNSGNANTCNADGVEKANTTCALAAKATGLKPEDFIIGSTGVIGQPIHMEPIEKGVALLAPLLSKEGGHDAAEAIMTTDTVAKEVAYQGDIGGKTVVLGGIAKGSGMIHPNMATMLSFLTTDAAIRPAMLQKALRAVVDDTFNMISIDGDSSTNDTVACLANGLAGNPPIQDEGADYTAFVAMLSAVLTDISRMIAADGEGASKLLTCRVSGAPDKDLARKIAKSIICSSLVKAAMFGADANWGRILCAIGYVRLPQHYAQGPAAHIKDLCGDYGDHYDYYRQRQRLCLAAVRLEGCGAVHERPVLHQRQRDRHPAADERDAADSRLLYRYYHGNDHDCAHPAAGGSANRHGSAALWPYGVHQPGHWHGDAAAGYYAVYRLFYR